MEPVFFFIYLPYPGLLGLFGLFGYVGLYEIGGRVLPGLPGFGGLFGFGGFGFSGFSPFPRGIVPLPFYLFIQICGVKFITPVTRYLRYCLKYLSLYTHPTVRGSGTK